MTAILVRLQLKSVNQVKPATREKCVFLLGPMHSYAFFIFIYCITLHPPLSLYPSAVPPELHVTDL